jgi:hypothetical protein
MKTTQYTVRNVPVQVDRYLRKQAELSGKSLNQVIIDELSEKSGYQSVGLADSLQFLIGSGMDDETLQALEDEDVHQKDIARRELDDAA